MIKVFYYKLSPKLLLAFLLLAMSAKLLPSGEAVSITAFYLRRRNL